MANEDVRIAVDKLLHLVQFNPAIFKPSLKEHPNLEIITNIWNKIHLDYINTARLYINNINFNLKTSKSCRGLKPSGNVLLRGRTKRRIVFDPVCGRPRATF